jgi:hypothetical protein
MREITHHFTRPHFSTPNRRQIPILLQNNVLPPLVHNPRKTPNSSRIKTRTVSEEKHSPRAADDAHPPPACLHRSPRWPLPRKRYLNQAPTKHGVLSQPNPVPRAPPSPTRQGARMVVAAAWKRARRRTKLVVRCGAVQEASQCHE